jgi:superfamily I DNA/RNA helicase
MLQKGFAARNVLILYRHKTIPWLRGYPLVEKLKLRLSEAGIVPDWISEDAMAKRTFDWDADTVKISTVQSAKGMDSPIVIILGAETFQHITRENEEEIDELKLLYVAMTRAREFLLVCYSGKGGLVSQLKNCEFEYEKYRDTIKTL